MAEEAEDTDKTVTGDRETDFRNAAIKGLPMEWDDVPEDSSNENSDGKEDTSAAAGSQADDVDKPVEATHSTSDTASNSSTAAEPVEKTEINEDELLGRLTGGKVKSKSELDAILSKKDLTKFPELEKLYDHFENKGNLETYGTIRKIGDVKELSDLDVVRTEMQISNPEMKPEAIDMILAQKYPTDEDNFSESQIALGKALLQLDANKSRQQLERIVEDLKLPQSAKDELQTQAAIDKFKNDWTGVVDTEIPAFNKFEITFPEDKIPFVYEIPKEDISELKVLADSMWKVPEIANKLAMGADGKFDTQKLLKTLYIASNFDKVATAVAINGKSRGIDEIKKTVTNQQEPGAKGVNDSGVRTGWQTAGEALKDHLGLSN